jgi:uncharacterized membrane protein YhaH (DUF805 family)
MKVWKHFHRIHGRTFRKHFLEVVGAWSLGGFGLGLCSELLGCGFEDRQRFEVGN